MVRCLGPAQGPKLLWPQPSACHKILGESQINSSLHYQSWEDGTAPGWTWMLEVAGGNKDEVGDAQRWGSPTGTVDAN